MRVAVDTGGTFTDFVAEADGEVISYKVPSTPRRPEEAVLEGLSYLKERLGRDIREVCHGTTVGTNAFLTRKGARVALLTTRGFEDVIFIGRQNRPELYSFSFKRPRPVVSKTLVLGVRERVLSDGTVEEPLSDLELERVKAWLLEKRPEAVAVSLLHSYAFPEHERRLKELVSSLGIHVSISSEVRPEFREFERTSTTLLNAYLAPVVARYVGRLTEALGDARLFVMQSNGGMMPAEAVERFAVMTLLSGPAGGVIGALKVAELCGFSRIITFDMGGTSTDVSLCDGAPTYTRDYQIEGYPVALPVMDIHTVGAGGGSVAWFDPGGALRVGPQSAGATPGPICYGRGGTQLTVTDANLILGRLLPHRFLGGRMPLNYELSFNAFRKAAGTRGLSPEELALSVLEVVNANMEKALRKVTLEKGHDPKDFVLVAFGGAGGLHAADLAERLGIRRILVPRLSGVLSALGILLSENRFLFSKGLRPGRDPVNYSFLKKVSEELKREALEYLGSLGIRLFDPEFRAEVDLRYKGQSYELTVDLSEGLEEAFHAEHERLYGYSLRRSPLEATALRLTIIEKPKRLNLSRWVVKEALRSVESTLIVERGVKRVRAKVFLWREVPAEAEFSGPALVVGDYATVYVPEGWRTFCDGYGNLHLEPS